MCYLCLKDNPFSTPEDMSDIVRKRTRALEIKRMLREADEYNLCYIGDATVERLKEEQYKIAREL